MEKKLFIAGSGGQGILFFGKMLAYAGTVSGKKVTWFPSYGAEIRGGTANCTVVISDDIIGSPVVTHPDILIVMNKESLEKFQYRLMKKGLLFYDSSLVKNALLRKDIRSVPVPATEISSSLGNTKSANMVMLGAVLAKTGILDSSSVFTLFNDKSNQSDIVNAQFNSDAFSEGITYIEDSKGKNSGP